LDTVRPGSANSPQGGEPEGALSLLFSLLRIGSQATEVQPFVNKMVVRIGEALQASVADLWFLEEGRLVLAGRHHTYGATVPAELALLTELPLDDSSLLGRASSSRRSLTHEGSAWPPKVLGLAGSLGLEYALATPLLSGERLMGAVIVLRQATHRFTDADTELLQICASYVALSVEHGRLFESQRRRVAELRHLLEVGRAITSSLDKRQLLRAAGENLAHMVDATHTFVWLLDAKKKTLRGVASSPAEHDEHFQTVEVSLQAPSLAGEAIRRLETIREEQAIGSDRVHPGLNERYRMKSLLALPLLVKGEPIGAITVGDALRRRRWTDRDVEQVTLVASQLAVALENARLFEDLKRSYDALALAQAQLVENERLAALGELAAVMAHEVRNPLGVIFNSMSGLRRILKPEGEAEVLFSIVNEEAERLNTIVGDLLDFSRPKSADRQPAVLSTIVQSALASTAAARAASNVRTVVEVGAQLNKVWVDARLVQQALTNLLLNAAQAMPQGGELRLVARLEKVQGVPWLCIEISDEGPGMTPELAERVFQPFFTTKAAGSGLGLAVVKRIAEAHGGVVRVLSRLGEGACFSLHLPQG
jgi:two-component system, NtrC family, sensor histidine kinase HydH